MAQRRDREFPEIRYLRYSSPRRVILNLMNLLLGAVVIPDAASERGGNVRHLPQSTPSPETQHIHSQSPDYLLSSPVHSLIKPWTKATHLQFIDLWHLVCSSHNPNLPDSLLDICSLFLLSTSCPVWCSSCLLVSLCHGNTRLIYSPAITISWILRTIHQSSAEV